ncbi:MAG: phosphate ABC transporter permease subunit PstC [Chloroflexota bacterium]
MTLQTEAAAAPRLTSERPQNFYGRTSLSKRPRPLESLIQSFLFLCGALSIATTLGIVYVLGQESLQFFTNPEVSLTEFFFTTYWQPEAGEYGIWALANSTFITSLIAMCVAVPFGLGAAVYLSEYASPHARNFLKPTLEILAGVPTVVYGYFALTFITPILRAVFGVETVEIYNMASAGLVMGIMILPLISSMSEDALHAVPRSLREAAFGLGATRFEVSTQVVAPAALSGVTAAFILGVSRAVGETMIVAIAAGSGSLFTFNPFKAAETMTGYIARLSGGDVSYASLQYQSIFAVGLMLFLVTLVLNIISRRIVARFREVYE